MDNSKEIKPRDEVAWFAGEMERTLRRNDHKGGWGHCSNRYLLCCLKKEVAELESCFERTCKTCGQDIKPDNTEPIKEATDVANFAMMIASNLRKTTL